jgi:hypothetical protein
MLRIVGHDGRVIGEGGDRKETCDTPGKVQDRLWRYTSFQDCVVSPTFLVVLWMPRRAHYQTTPPDTFGGSLFRFLTYPARCMLGMMAFISERGLWMSNFDQIKRT